LSWFTFISIGMSMSGYYKSSRKRKGQGATYHKLVPELSGCNILRAGPGYTGVESSFVMQRYLKQTTTSFRSGRDGVKDEIQPTSLLLKNQQENQRASLLDNGHPFETRCDRIFQSHPRVTLRGSGGSFYQGPLFGTTTGGNQLNWPNTWAGESDFSHCFIPDDDITYGTRAMAKVAPDMSPSHLLQALGELKQDFPRIPLVHSFNKLKRPPRDEYTSNATGLGHAVGALSDETLNLLSS
jgi:hypothetical protein